MKESGVFLHRDEVRPLELERLPRTGGERPPPHPPGKAEGVGL